MLAKFLPRAALLAEPVAALAASTKLMGIYTGSTVHELAGVVAAGNAPLGALKGRWALAASARAEPSTLPGPPAPGRGAP